MDPQFLLLSFPAPLFELLPGFSNPAALLKRGMKLVSEEQVTINGQKSVLFQVRQTSRGIEYLKWILVLGNQKESVMVLAQFPKELESELSKKMRASLLTVRWESEKSISPFEGLNFSVPEKGELRIAKRMANMLLYTREGIFPSKDIDEPLFVVAQSLAKVEIGDAEEFAKARILKTAEVMDIAVERSSGVKIDNLTGYATIANAKDKASGQPMVIYQVVLFDSPNYFIIQGLVSNKNRKRDLPLFQEMAGTFKRKKQ